MRGANKPLMLETLLWAFWFALLIATPYFVSDPYDGGLQSGLYAYVALGFIVGAWLAAVHSRLFDSLLFGKIATVVTVIGVLLSAAVLALEWGYLPLCLKGMPEAAFSPFRPLIDTEPFCLFVASCACSFTGVRSLRNEATFGASDAQKAVLPCRYVQILGAALPVVLFLLGFVKTAVWSPFLPYMGHPIVGLQVHMGVPFAFVFVPPVVTALLGVVVVCAVRMVAKAYADKGNILAVYGAILIMAFGLGLVCWNMLTRVAQVGGIALVHASAGVLAAQVLAAVLALGVIVLFVQGRRSFQCEQAHLSRESKSDDDKELSQAVAAVLMQSGLTARESRAIELMLAKRSSAESAESMGIRPSTVRAYLQRAYKKLGVANAEEAIDILGSLDEGESPVSQVSQKHEQRRPRYGDVCALVSLGGAFGVVITLFVPHAIDYTAWGVGRELLVGGGSALVAAGALGLYSRWLAGHGMVGEWKGEGAGARAFAAMAGAAMLCCGLIVVYCLFCLSRGATGVVSSLVFACASFAFVAGWVAGAVRSFAAVGANGQLARGGALTVSVVTVLCVASSISREMRLASAVIFLIAAASALFYPLKSAESPVAKLQGECTCRATQDTSLVVFGAGMFFALGFAGEELWRSLSVFSVIDAAVFPLAPIIAGGMGFAWSKRPFVRIVSWIPVLVAGVGFATGQGYDGLFIGALLQALMLAMHGFRCGLFDMSTLFLWVVFSGFGCLVGVVGIDAASDFLLLGDALLNPFGGRTELSERFLILVNAFFLALGFAAVLFSHRLHNDEWIRYLTASLEKGADERVRHYLLGRGLNETQTCIIMEVVRGHSSTEISESLNYSRGTVNSARNASYRLLEVRSRAQLIALLQKNAGL